MIQVLHHRFNLNKKMNERLSRLSAYRPLEGATPAPSSLNIIKFTFKLLSGLMLLLLLTLGEFCSGELNDLVLASCIILLIESFIMIFFILSKYKSDSCVTCSSYFLTFYMILDFLTDVFYIVWVIYYSFIFFEDDECSDQTVVEKAAQIYTLVYFMFTSSLMICCCGAKVCMIMSTVSSSSNTKEGTLTGNLLDEKEPRTKQSVN